MKRILQKLGIQGAIVSESGVTAIEYGLIAALVAIVIIGAITTIGLNLTAVFTGVSGSLHT
jgi:pilus assembly protein Flp/PilA